MPAKGVELGYEIYYKPPSFMSECLQKDFCGTVEFRLLYPDHCLDTSYQLTIPQSHKDRNGNDLGQPIPSQQGQRNKI
ncbi:hypothetical protein D5086_009470 [Populus alba]|uniref:Uncharacterized protein n=1 Tax=Populus alba TaxID=43335 RepID=A0ACC4CIH1_POPAL